MLIEDLINKVRVLIDEHSPFADSELLIAKEEEGFETKPMTTYIDNTIDDSANEMLCILPLHLIEADRLDVLQHVKRSNGSGILGVGDNFLRVHTLKFATWERPVHINFKEGDAMCDLQYNPYTMGRPNKPVVVLRKDRLIVPMNNALWYYSCPPTDKERKIEIGWQVSRFDRYKIQDDLSDIFALNCASKVFAIMGMLNESKMMSERLSASIMTRSK